MLKFRCWAWGKYLGNSYLYFICQFQYQGLLTHLRVCVYIYIFIYLHLCVCVCVCACVLTGMLSCSAVSDSLWTRGLYIACQAPLSMGILRARILGWVAMPSSRGSSQLRDQNQVSCIAGKFFTVWAIREAYIYIYIERERERERKRERKCIYKYIYLYTVSVYVYIHIYI